MPKPTTHDSCTPFLNDEQLFYNSLKAMSDQAYTCLYTRVYTPCIDYAMRNNGSPEEAIDHLQTTLEQFMHNIDLGAYQYQPTTKVSTYFIEMFRRSWLGYLRQRGRRDVALRNIDMPDEDVLLTDSLETDLATDTALVIQAMALLSSQCRQIIELFYVDDLPIRQLAQQVQLDPDTAKNQLYRCRKYLKTQYRQLTRLPL